MGCSQGGGVALGKAALFSRVKFLGGKDICITVSISSLILPSLFLREKNKHRNQHPKFCSLLEFATTLTPI